MAFASGFYRAGKIGEGAVIDFERNGFNAMRRIAKPHLASLAEQAEPGNVSNSVDTFRTAALFLHLLERQGGIAIQSCHCSDRGGERFRRSSILLQRRCDDPSSQRFGEKQNV